jgi:hypothetical protein
VYEAESAPAGYSDITFKRNPLYFGYDASIMNPAGTPYGPNGETHWGPYDIEYIILKYLPDALTRFSELELHNVDFGEYPTAPVETFEALDGKYPGEFRVKKAPYVASNDVWINFNNPALSNRYIRLAIAYATPYQTIFSEILPSWGVVEPLPPKSWVLPWSVYTEPAAYGGDTVNLYYDSEIECPSYSYDLTLAQEYYNMYKYAQTGQPYVDGPIGDANFDGIVGLKDVFLTIAEIGRGQPPYTRQIDWWNTDWSDGTYPWPVASGMSYAPGNDVDADFNNDGTHTAADFALCTENWGNKYPEGAVW